MGGQCLLFASCRGARLLDQSGPDVAGDITTETGGRRGKAGGAGGIGVDSCVAVEEVIQVLSGCIGQGETCRLSALSPPPPPPFPNCHHHFAQIYMQAAEKAGIARSVVHT